jgi:drug/metabolite transporter (DMT)-like permease
MILLSLISGHRLHITEWIGVTVSFFGFLYLVLPAVTTPSVTGFILMSVAGIAWGIYTLKGRGSQSPVRDTAYNFIRSVIFVVILAAMTFQNTHYSKEGILLAVASGGLTSGLGYVLWYKALGGLSSVQAAVVQLLVPVLAAYGGILYVSETITPRLTLAALLILGGILMVILGRQYALQRNLKRNLS